VFDIFRIYKNIFIDYTLLITAACVIIFGNINLYYIIFAAIIHELAHYAAARITGFKPDSFIIRGLGIELSNVKNRFSPGILIFVAVCGPLANLFLATIGYMYNNYLFFLVNISIAAINFVPAFPLDGGQILYGILARHYNRKRAKNIIKISGRIIGIIMILLGICLLYISRLNFSMLYIGVLIFLTSNSDFYNPVLEVLNTKEKDFRKCNIFLVSENLNAIEVADSLPCNSIGMVKNKEGKIYEYITPYYLYSKLINSAKNLTMKEILQKK